MQMRSVKDWIDSYIPRGIITLSLEWPDVETKSLKQCVIVFGCGKHNEFKAGNHLTYKTID